MSCFIMSDQAHAATANTLEYILNSGFNRFGFDAPDILCKALSDCRDRYGFYCSGLIFRRLYDLNSRAYAGRYKTVTDTTPPEMPSVPPLVQEREREDQHEKAAALALQTRQADRLRDIPSQRGRHPERPAAPGPDRLLPRLHAFPRFQYRRLQRCPMGRDLTPAAGYLRGPHRTTKRPDPISKTPKPKHRRNPKCTNKQA